MELVLFAGEYATLQGSRSAFRLGATLVQQVPRVYLLPSQKNMLIVYLYRLVLLPTLPPDACRADAPRECRHFPVAN